MESVPVVPHLEATVAGVERESQVKSPAVGHVSRCADLRLPPIVSGSCDEHDAGVIGTDGLVDLSIEYARAVGRPADRSLIEEHHHRHRQFSRLVDHKIDRDE